MNTRAWVRIVFAALPLAAACAGVATAADGAAAPPQSGPGDNSMYAQSFDALFQLFVLAVIIESALATLFRWKPFLNVFDGKAVNPVIAFLVSFVVVVGFDCNIVSELMKAYTGRPGVGDGSTLMGFVLTAMTIAGGSAGVNRLFQAFGLRLPSSQEAPAPSLPPPGKAFISVTPVRKDARGPITVLVDNQAVATIVRAAGGRLFGFLLRNPGRFPQSGGYALDPGKARTIVLTGADATGKTITSQWGPHELAPGAIVDLELQL